MSLSDALAHYPAASPPPLATLRRYAEACGKCDYRNWLKMFAEHIAQILLKDFNAPWVKVSVANLQAIRGSKMAGIYIERGQIR